MALPVLDATFASAADLPRRQMLAKWLVEELGSGSIADYYDLPERYLWAKIAVAAGASRPEADYVSLPKNYAWSDIYNAVASASGSHTDWTEKQALGHIAAAYRGDTANPEALATYIDWPWRYQVASIVTHLGIDADALSYIQRVETADGASLESGVRLAIDNFVRGCKTDGIWDAIKASTILAGARTLSGALQPLVGAAPTNFNFVSGDYNRKTGLIGDGNTKYLNSNRDNNADPQDNSHMALYSAVSWPERNGFYFAGMGAGSSGASLLRSITGVMRFLIKSTSGSLGRNFTRNPGFVGMARFNSTAFQSRLDSQMQVFSSNSVSAIPGPISIFTDSSIPTSGVTNARLAFYSIGESLDLALLDARVTDLINAYAAAIP
jgi:hypothetical protein